MSLDYLDELPIGVAVFDGQRQLVEANRLFTAFFQVTGRQRESGMTYAAILEAFVQASDQPPDQYGAFIHQRLAAADAATSDTYRIGDRGVWAFDFHCAFRHDHSAILSVTDISAFAHKEALFADAEQMSRSGVWELDLASGGLTFSDGAWAVFGPGSQEVMGDLTRWGEFVHPDDRERYLAAVNHSLATLQPYELSYRVYRSDGQLMHVAAKGKVIYDRHGKPRWGRGIFQDVTQISEAEEALQRSEKHFRSLIENALDIITILEADGTIRYESPSIVRILGYKANELIGRNVFSFVHPDDAQEVMRTFAEQSAIAGPAPAIEFRFRHKDGSWRILEAIGTNLLADPAVAGIVVNSRDMTERRQLEEQFRQAQKMEAIGRLTAGVAHDFNNLLTAMSGFAELMRLEMPADDPAQESLERILHAGRRAADLVRQLLAFSRKQVLEPRILNLNTVVAGMDTMLRRIIGEDIELKTRLAPELWLVKIDPSQIEQVIINLAVNARDAMPQGGRLTIETANVFLDDAYVSRHFETQPGEYVLLAMSDSGVGMSEEVKARIFEPFFTTKEQGKGTGLGLATVYGILKQNHGHIWVYSEPGAGATFKLYLPHTEELPADAIQEEWELEMLSGSETILLVEDDGDVRDLVRRVLQAQGYTMLEAAHGREALRLAADYRGPIHLLLTDVIMPGMNGKLLADQLLALRPGLKILFMSGYTDNAIAHHGLLDPGVFLLQKPFGPRALARKLREVLDS